MQVSGQTSKGAPRTRHWSQHADNKEVNDIRARRKQRAAARKSMRLTNSVVSSIEFCRTERSLRGKEPVCAYSIYCDIVQKMMPGHKQARE